MKPAALLKFSTFSKGDNVERMSCWEQLTPAMSQPWCCESLAPELPAGGPLAQASQACAWALSAPSMSRFQGCLQCPGGEGEEKKKPNEPDPCVLGEWSQGPASKQLPFKEAPTALQPPVSITDLGNSCSKKKWALANRENGRVGTAWLHYVRESNTQILGKPPHSLHEESQSSGWEQIKLTWTFNRQILTTNLAAPLFTTFGASWGSECK